MNKLIIKKFTRYISILFISTLLSSGIAFASEKPLACRSTLSPQLSISQKNFSGFLRSLISGSYLNRKDMGNLGEHGFVFTDWKKQRINLASGLYGKVQEDDLKAIASSFKGIPAQKVLRSINSRLANVKDRIIEESNGVFTEKDFDVNVIVQEGAWKSATFEIPAQEGKGKGQKPVLYINKHSFRNLDFLYMVIKHELIDIKAADLLPNLNPAQRELFTLITVDVEEFIKLRDISFARAKKLLDDFRDVAHMDRGLFLRYERLLNNTTFIDAFSEIPFHHVPYISKKTLTLFEDIAYMVADEKNKSAYPQMRKAMQDLILNNGVLDLNAIIRARIQVRCIKRYVLESERLIGDDKLENLAGKKKKDVPAVLHAFSPYAENVHFKRDGDSGNVFIKVKFVDEEGVVQYAHIYLGEKDKINSTLGSHGRIFGLTLRNWRKARPELFNFRFEKDAEELVRYRERVWNYKLPTFIGEISGKNINMRKKMYAHVYGILKSLNMNKSALGNMTWQQLSFKAKNTASLNDYEELAEIIAGYLERIYPQEFLGFIRVQNEKIKNIQMWGVWDNPNITSLIASWMRPDVKQYPPEFYAGASAISIADLFKILNKQMSSALDKGSEKAASVTKTVPKRSVEASVLVLQAI